MAAHDPYTALWTEDAMYFPQDTPAPAVEDTQVHWDRVSPTRQPPEQSFDRYDAPVPDEFAAYPPYYASGGMDRYLSGASPSEIRNYISWSLPQEQVIPVAPAMESHPGGLERYLTGRPPSDIAYHHNYWGAAVLVR